MQVVSKLKVTPKAYSLQKWNQTKGINIPGKSLMSTISLEIKDKVATISHIHTHLPTVAQLSQVGFKSVSHIFHQSVMFIHVTDFRVWSTGWHDLLQWVASLQQLQQHRLTVLKANNSVHVFVPKTLSGRREHQQVSEISHSGQSTWLLLNEKF